MAEAQPRRCEDLFRKIPFELHSILFLRAREDQRLGVRVYDESERLQYRVTARNGLLYFKGHLLDTTNGTAERAGRRGIQILALDKDMNLLTTEHAPAGEVHHSTLTARGPGYFFGEWRVRQGKVVMVSNMSGHYEPSIRELFHFVDFLASLRVLHPEVDIVEIYPDPRRD